MKVFVLVSVICALVLESDAYCQHEDVIACANTMLGDPNLHTQQCELYNNFLHCIEEYRRRCEITEFWTQLMASFEQTEQMCSEQVPQVERECDSASVLQCSWPLIEERSQLLISDHACSFYATFAQCVEPYKADCEDDGPGSVWYNIEPYVQLLEQMCA